MNHAQRALLERLDKAGIRLRIEGGVLAYRAPCGTMTPELRATLVEWKPDLLYEYHERAGILEYDAHLPRPEAETRAANSMQNGRPYQGKTVQEQRGERAVSSENVGL